MAKSKLIVTSREGDILRFTVGEAGTLEIDLSALADEIRDEGLEHGITQKVSDAAAMSRDELTGNPKKDAVTKLEAMRAVVERLTSDEPSWNKRSGDGSAPVAGLIFRAYSEWAVAMATERKSPIPSDDALRAKYDAMDRKQKLALRNVPAIATIIERMKSERPAKAVAAVDTDALLADLGV